MYHWYYRLLALFAALSGAAVLALFYFHYTLAGFIGLTVFTGILIAAGIIIPRLMQRDERWRGQRHIH